MVINLYRCSICDESDTDGMRLTVTEGQFIVCPRCVLKALAYPSGRTISDLKPTPPGEVQC